MFESIKEYQEELYGIAKNDLPWQKLENKSILITGAAGMIGTTLVDALMFRNRYYAQNAKIIAIGRSEKNARERFSKYWQDNNFQFLSLDVNKPLDIDMDIDFVIHAASNTHPRAYAQDPIGTIMTNLLGTNNLLELAVKKHAKRCMFFSSVEIYGEPLHAEDVFSEEYCGYIDCNTLRAGYPEGKRAGETLCQAYREKYGLDIVIPRISRVFGPTMKLSDSKAMSQFILNAVHKEDIILKSKGMQKFSYTYTADVVAALLYVLLKGSSGEAYNIAGTGKILSLYEIAEILASVAERKVIFELPDQVEKKGFSKAQTAVLVANKIERLGWSMRYDMQTSLMRTVKILKRLKSNILDEMK